MADTEPPTTGLLNLEKELVCFICTEVLYQPLTLLDCLHTFCGSCLKQWFSHQHRKATQSHSSFTASPYTCPTCRAPVKDVQHNAMINTLLEMFLAASPGKDRSAEEKEEMAQIYKPGDKVLPKIESHRRRERRRREEAEGAARERGAPSHELHEGSRRDQQAYATSTDSGLTPQSTIGTSRSRERRDRTEGIRDLDRQERRQRHQGTGSVAHTPTPGSSSLDLSSLSPPTGSPRHPDAVEARQRGARTVAHQASLISLVSASESGTGTGDSLNEAQLMQEILAEGLLDGINVEELTEAEQDELSEFIAERYRQLHPERMQRTRLDEAGANPVLNEAQRPEVQVEEADRHPRQSSRNSRRHQTEPSPRSNRSVTIGGTDGRPPSAFPHSAAEQTLTPPRGPAHRRRASNESGRRETSATRAGRISQPSGSRNASAARSATDLSDRPQSAALAAESRPQLANPSRSNTEPRTSPRASEVWHSTGRQISSPPHLASSSTPSMRVDDLRPLMSSINTAPVPTSIPTSDPAPPAPGPLLSSATSAQVQSEEPAIVCARCSRPSIQYELHKHCPPCKLDLCLRCYRAGRGCNHWYGFGHAAMLKFEASLPMNRSSQAIELPHILIGRRYQRPSSPTGQGAEQGNVAVAPSDPTTRLQEGNFCDRCANFADECFWSCDYCNEGEWGFCNDCVNTNHCCNHPLLPIAHKPVGPRTINSRPGTSGTEAGGAVTLSPFSAVGRVPSPAQSALSSTNSMNGTSPCLRPDSVPLVITTYCDFCSRPVSPEEIRYHCPGHPTPSPENPDQKGDFDICSSCYHGFVKTGRIPRDEGPDGWRLCPSGHRMIEVTFEQDRDEGQRRVVLRDLVGGAKMTEEDMVAWKLANTQLTSHAAAAADFTAFSVPGLQGQWVWREDASGTRRATRVRTATLPGKSKFPPDGGLGKVCRALWSYYPEEGEEGKGELLFPKHAEVREVEDINEDWSFGVYAGDKGVFPTVYVREIA